MIMLMTMIMMMSVVIMGDVWCMMDRVWWMMFDGWLMICDDWYMMMDDGWWMMCDVWFVMYLVRMMMMMMMMLCAWTFCPSVDCSDRGPYALDQIPYCIICPFQLYTKFMFFWGPCASCRWRRLNFARSGREALYEVRVGIKCPFWS